MFKRSSLINDVSVYGGDFINSHPSIIPYHPARFWSQHPSFRSEQGQATVEYLLVIGVVVVAVAAAFYQRELFEALSSVFNTIAELVARPDP